MFRKDVSQRFLKCLTCSFAAILSIFCLYSFGIAFHIPCNVLFLSCILPDIIYTFFNMQYCPPASLCGKEPQLLLTAVPNKVDLQILTASESLFLHIHTIFPCS